jgi:hypothetical protein
MKSAMLAASRSFLRMEGAGMKRKIGQFHHMNFPEMDGKI